MNKTLSIRSGKLNKRRLNQLALQTLIGALTLNFVACSPEPPTEQASRSDMAAQPDVSMKASSEPYALTGTVSSSEEGLMEGVVVSAKRNGSTITVSVVSDLDGRYRFPEDRLEPGIYNISIQSISNKIF